MKKTFLSVGLAMAASVAMFSRASAQDVNLFVLDDESPAKEYRVVVDAQVSKYWIGVMANPVSDLVKQQMRLSNGLGVSEVIDDGPADNSGVKVHDILLKFNGKSLNDVGALLKAVGESKGKKSELIVLRGGSEKKISIQPGERPKGQRMQIHSDIELPKELRGVLRGGGANGNMFFFGPGMRMMPGQNVDIDKLLKGHFKPGQNKDGKNESLSLSITRGDDGPAKIIVKRNGEEYEATEETLDKLPEDIRAKVKLHLKGEGGAAPEHGLRWIRPRVRLDLEHGRPNPGIEEQLKRMRMEMNKILKELDSLRDKHDDDSDDEESVDA